MPSAVLFDLYGTLVDIEVCEESISLWQGVAKWVSSHLGRDAKESELHREYVRLCQEQKLIHGEGFILPVVFQELLGGKVSDKQVRSFAHEFRRLSTTSFEVRSYTVPLLSRLRAEQHRLALVSNTEGILTNYDIDRHGLRTLFDAIILSSEVGIAKPHPEILSKALDSISAVPEDALFVGDSLEADAEVAAALGMPCVIITKDHERSAREDIYHARSSITFVRPELQEIYAAVTAHINADLIH